MTNAEKLNGLLAEIDGSRHTFLSLLASLSQEQLAFQPAGGEWSIGEVAHHIGLTEQTLQNTVKELFEKTPQGSVVKKIGAGELPMGPSMIPQRFLEFAAIRAPIALTMTLMPRFLQSFILANPIIKVRTAPAVTPTPGLLRQDLLSLLERRRAVTLALVEPLRDRDLSRYRWQHPLLGARDVYATLEMLDGHDRRHLAQIERIQRARGFPTS